LFWNSRPVVKRLETLTFERRSASWVLHVVREISKARVPFSVRIVS